jgi:hypothetical protein
MLAYGKMTMKYNGIDNENGKMVVEMTLEMKWK